MDVPDRENCSICGKSLKKSSIKRHIATVHSKNAAEKKSSRIDREAAKKKALQNATQDIFNSGTISDSRLTNNSNSNNRSYAIPASVTDKDLEKIMQEFEFMSVDENPLMNNTPKVPKKREQPELAIQRKLEKQYGGGHKETPLGIIDILSTTEIIEVKNWNDFIKGFGQLLVYAEYYPNHMKHIHFFGEPPPADKEIVIRTLFAKYGIKVTQERWP